MTFHPSVAAPPDLTPFPTRVLAACLRDEGLANTGEVHCILTGDAELAELNSRFRGRQGATDVLTFPYDPDLSAGVHGDIYVSFDRARLQAADRGESVAREVWRLFVHGALHLAGHDHETDAADASMRATQEHWVERAFPSPGATGA